jgi:hypothetical protein
MLEQKIKIDFDGQNDHSYSFTLTFTAIEDITFSDWFYRFLNSDAYCCKLGNNDTKAIITKDYLKDKLITITENFKEND